MTFKHELIELPYEDLLVKSDDGKRKYVTPDGNRYPSVTTVVGYNPETRAAIAKWTKRVGKKEAEKISTRAKNRGLGVHQIVENYINNEENYVGDAMPTIIDNFNRIKEWLDKHVNIVLGIETPLYSDLLQMAGRADLIAMYENPALHICEPAIIDIKTSRKPKREAWITDYFLQKTAYSIMLKERTGITANKIITVIQVDGMPQAQVFIRDAREFVRPLYDLRSLYFKDHPMTFFTEEVSA